MVSTRSVNCPCGRLLRSNLIFAMIFFLVGCSSASLSPTPAPVIEATSTLETFTPAPDYVSQLRNAEYQLGAANVPRLVPLTDGKFESGSGGADQVTVTMTDFVAKGDVDSSGTDEYAVLVSENYGGSGSFMFLAVYADVNGTMKFQTSRMVDDRPQINVLSFTDTNEVFLDAVVHRTSDPMCCPTLRTTRHYRLDKLGALTMTDYVTFTPDGKPRTITIESPVNSAEVFNSFQLKGSVAIAPFENNLEYHIFDMGSVELGLGSITVSASAPGAPGAFDQAISLGNILSGVAIRVEVRDISAADGSLLGMDSVELVVK